MIYSKEKGEGVKNNNVGTSQKKTKLAAMSDTYRGEECSRPK